MKRCFFKSELGQTSIEYLMLLAVSIGLGTTFYKKMKEYLLENETGVFSRQLKSLDKRFDKSQGYKRFPLSR